MRNIFISDIHWNIEELEELLKLVEFSKNDVLYILWDMIDDWPPLWFEVLRYLYSLGDQCTAILWNHEQILIKNFDHIVNPLDTAPIDSDRRFIAKKIQQSSEIYDYLHGLPNYIEWANFIGVHRWLMPGKTFQEQKSQLWNIQFQRSIPFEWFQSYTEDKVVIYGHWWNKNIQKEWLTMSQKDWKLQTLCIDLWAKSPYGNLWAYILETGEMISVPWALNKLISSTIK